MRIEPSAPLANLVRGVQRQNSAAERSPEEVRAGLRVTLSELGRGMSGRATGKNKDIDESALPDGIKQLLKMIRELKAQIAEKQAELQALMVDQNLDPETKSMRAELLQSALATLNGALASANANLVKQMSEGGLSPEQAMTAASLAMA